MVVRLAAAKPVRTMGVPQLANRLGIALVGYADCRRVWTPNDRKTHQRPFVAD
jgi:hypothetical protein